MPRRALVAYSSSSTHVQTTLDYLIGFKNHSGFETSFVHATHDAKIDFDLARFDLVFHNYCSRFCFEGYVSEDYRKKLKAFRGLKILAVQDEYDHTNVLKAAIKDIGFHIVLTCVPQDSLEYVYPKKEFPGVTFLTVFTGYVTDDFLTGRPEPPALKDRPIVVGYRGRNIGGRYGRLGFDKFEIGRRMKEVCDAKGVVNDIAMDEASRIYGTAWFDYLGRCRSMLGSESGSNVFDFDGSIDALYKKMMAENGGVAPSYEAMLPLVAERDGAIQMGQISPRVFECAIMRTPMVLFKGRYSDAIKPDEHYISLEKDFSNVDEVLRRLEDIPALEAMTARAYDHLVGTGTFNYATFFGMIGKTATKLMKTTKRASGKPVEANSSGLVLRDWFGYEKPSTLPEKPEMFRMRVSLAEIRLLKGEDDRLSAAFVDHRALLLTNLEGQAVNLRNARAELARTASDSHQSSGKPVSAEAEDFFPEITAFLAESDAIDRDWLKQWDGTVKRVNTAIAQHDASALNIGVEEALAGVRLRYKVIGEKWSVFGSLYEQGMKRMAEQIAHPGKAHLKDAAVQMKDDLRVDQIQARIDTKMPWATALYQRMAAGLRRRIRI